MILTVAVFVVLVVGYGVVVAKVWRGESRLDPASPAPWWPFGAALWRGTARALPVQGACVLVLLGGGIAADLIGEGSGGYDAAMAVGAAGLLGLLGLALPVAFASRPRFLVPPHQRDEPSTLEEWRRDRGR